MRHHLFLIPLFSCFCIYTIGTANSRPTGQAIPPMLASNIPAGGANVYGLGVADGSVTPRRESATPSSTALSDEPAPSAPLPVRDLLGFMQQTQNLCEWFWGHLRVAGHDIRRGVVNDSNEIQGADALVPMSQRLNDAYNSALCDYASLQRLQAIDIPRNSLSSVSKMISGFSPAVTAALTTTLGFLVVDNVFQLSSRYRSRKWANIAAFLSAFHGVQCESYRKATNRSYLIGVSMFIAAFMFRILSVLGKPKKNPYDGTLRPSVRSLLAWSIEDACVAGLPCRIAGYLEWKAQNYHPQD